MRGSCVIFFAIVFLAFSASLWAQCPEEWDRGECDTIHYEAYSSDLPPASGPPYFVRVPIRVTHDVNDPVARDSVAGFVIPICYTTDSPSLYCSVSNYWNETAMLYVIPQFVRSIFRHLSTAPADSNRMAKLAQDFSGREWDTAILDLDGTSHFWLSLVPTGSPDQRWWEGNRVLLATITFKIENDMQVCMDTCIWLPESQLSFAVSDAQGTGKTFVPRFEGGADDYLSCFSTSAVREIAGSDDARPPEFSLSQNYPNPFNPATNIEFRLVKATHVELEIFNIVGQRVRTLVDEDMKAGTYVADWDGNDENGNAVSSGIYFYRMEAGDFSDMKKMLLVK